ncbi:DEAD/DEAH box helicase [Robiginitalea sp. M366]|uniref:DEAD/DEAH box helicase n=1 Tax=Robiginitalea aestuariiviva TaxID=3036903 RepID=UPI00240E8458|nr:DEAD/DEAH box helicase [Robiginitalea aestuariiviva]MDG1573508.1 DEAD/DEAH box helicase [Robiginitalea aestuariiviva]
MSTFTDLGLSAPVLKAIEALGFETPTEIQQRAIPELLTGDKDLVALAQTGTGKTAAFGLPLLECIDTDSRTTQAIILAPTRELCLQITNEMQAYAKFIPGFSVVAVYGGASIQEQARALKRGAHIIAATPGRIKDMISRGLADLSKVTYCVLDEADEMLNMGFYEDLTDILSHTPSDKSTWLFSATMPDAVARIAREFMHQPTELTVGGRNVATATVRHEYYLVGGRERYAALRRLADANPGLFSVVFCRTKRDAQKVAEKLIEDGYNAGALHGDLSQQQRDLVMSAFRKRQLQLLVATDVAARGIDVDDITHVIHYQLPDDIETYTHRSGRTGRAGKSGVSLIIMTRSERGRIRALERITGRPFEELPLPTGMEICEIQLYHLADSIRNTEIHPEVKTYLPAVNDLLDGLDRDDLIAKMVSVEFSRFAEFYAKNQDPKASPKAGGTSEQLPGNAPARFFINVGERDGLDWMILKDMLKEATGLGKEDIFKVETKDSFSFFSTEPEVAPLILESLKGANLEGREIKVELTDAPPAYKGKKKPWKKGGKPPYAKKGKGYGKPPGKKGKGYGKPAGKKNKKGKKQAGKG